MPAPDALATLTVVVAVLVIAATAVVVPPVVGRPIINTRSPVVIPVVLPTVNVLSAELLTLAVVKVETKGVVLPWV